GSARLARAGRTLSRRLLGTACCQPGFATCPGPRQRLGLGLFLELDAFTDVTFSTLSRQLHLTLAFCEAALLLIGVLVMAVDAADTLDEMPGGLVFGAQRLATGAAEFIIAGLKAMAHGNPLVKNETISAPQAVLFGHGLEVFENTAFQVINLVVAQRTHVGGGLLAADATRAEHGDLALAVQHAPFLALGFDPGREFREAAGLGIHGPFEGTDAVLVVVTRIDHHHFGIGNQLVPVFGPYVDAGHGLGMNVRDAHGHDLALELDLHAVERHARRP